RGLSSGFRRVRDVVNPGCSNERGQHRDNPLEGGHRSVGEAGDECAEEGDSGSERGFDVRLHGVTGGLLWLSWVLLMMSTTSCLVTVPPSPVPSLSTMACSAVCSAAVWVFR